MTSSDALWDDTSFGPLRSDLSDRRARAADAVRPILRLGKGSIAKFRLAQIVCPHDHHLADVLATPLGPVYVARPNVRLLAYDAGRPGSLRATQVEHVQAVFVDVLEPELTSFANVPGLLPAGCRCRPRAIDAYWVRSEIKAGRTRLRLTDE